MRSKYFLAAAVMLMLSTPAYAQKGNPAHGAEIFKRANCVMCHPGGNNALEPSKPIRGASFLKKYPTDELIAKRIREGSPNGTMPSFYKDQINDKELVDLIAYVRSLTPSPASQAQPKQQPQHKQQPAKSAKPPAKKAPCSNSAKGKH
jgi:mono/diheme cytochrome c family protein